MILSFDAAQTLVDVNWHPGGFAYSSATEYGLRLDEQVAIETYDRFVMSTRREYEQLNLSGDRSACLRYWDELTSQWLERLGQDAALGKPLSEFARARMFDPNGGCFKLYPEVLPVLEKLRRLGHEMVVLSNWDYSLDRVLEMLGIREFFRATFASLEHGVEKPDVGLFRVVERHMGLPSEQFIHFGDNPIDDLDGSIGAGWRGVLIDRSITQPTRPRIPDLSFVEEALAWED